MKQRGHLVTAGLLQRRASASAANGYPKQKWIEFCEALMAEPEGYLLYLVEAASTFSKYITVTRPNDPRRYCVRFSNHKPNKGRELNGDCDFFVGHTHTGVYTTRQALAAVIRYFAQPIPIAPTIKE